MLGILNHFGSAFKTNCRCCILQAFILPKLLHQSIMEKGITEERKRSLITICCIKEPRYLYYVVVNNIRREMQREVLLKVTAKTSTPVSYNINFFI